MRYLVCASNRLRKDSLIEVEGRLGTDGLVVRVLVVKHVREYIKVVVIVCHSYFIPPCLFFNLSRLVLCEDGYCCSGNSPQHFPDASKAIFGYFTACMAALPSQL
jgi:hypothetical protein